MLQRHRTLSTYVSCVFATYTQQVYGGFTELISSSNWHWNEVYIRTLPLSFKFYGHAFFGRLLHTPFASHGFFFFDLFKLYILWRSNGYDVSSFQDMAQTRWITVLVGILIEFWDRTHIFTAQ